MQRSKSAIALLFPILLLVAPACDPCFGTTACVAPHLAADGTLIWHLDGSPATGVRVEFRRTGGLSLPDDVLVSRTDVYGRFRYEAQTGAAGEVHGTLAFFPPEPYDHFPFYVEGVTISTTRVRGESRRLGYWGVGPLPAPPHLSYVGELYFRDTNARAEGVEIQFRRTGGVSVHPDTFTVVSGSDGRFPLFMTPSGPGEVLGEIRVNAPAPYRSFAAPVRMETLRGAGETRLVGVWGLSR
jgi:hypothetical protein